MLIKFLSDAISNLEELIKISNLDMQDIKEANHDAIFQRLESKNNAILMFDRNKDLARDAMLKLSKENPNKSIEEILNPEALMLIDKMRDGLKTLREINKNYAKSVVAVYEFYNSLLENIIPSQRDGYSNKLYSKVDLLRIEA
ncbi:hypothetical protein [Helicobacter sp. MIT 99-5507]|uniref:hypothetical protein n=1 Tax=Helicobacter sp. MIT 99-5507 TaxID=152489 RepID=UPI000E1F2178|nr:hypothetical protein [Helicobacter sp. MIT 99-5507]RDU58139.1 hypothetical protein CQA42_04360 [Helicobacter sp. MIT 99-5507]